MTRMVWHAVALLGGGAFAFAAAVLLTQPLSIALVGLALFAALELAYQPRGVDETSDSHLFIVRPVLLQQRLHRLHHQLVALEGAQELQRSVFEASAELVSCVDEQEARARFASCMRIYWACDTADLYIWERGSWRCLREQGRHDLPAAAEPLLRGGIQMPDQGPGDLILDLSPGVEGQAALVLHQAYPQPTLARRSVEERRHVAEVLRSLLALSLRRVLLYERLQTLGRSDPLTGCFRRWYGESRLQELVERDQVVSVLLADIDHFKNVNDQHGHSGGDRVLTAVGHCLRNSLRTGDICCRWGGEEFFVLLPQTSDETALRVAERLRAQVAALADLPQVVTVSIGVASCHIDETVASLIQRVDDALYAAKHAGRDCVVQAAADLNSGETHIRRKTKRYERQPPTEPR